MSQGPDGHPWGNLLSPILVSPVLELLHSQLVAGNRIILSLKAFATRVLSSQKIIAFPVTCKHLMKHKLYSCKASCPLHREIGLKM